MHDLILKLTLALKQPSGARQLKQKGMHPGKQYDVFESEGKAMCLSIGFGSSRVKSAGFKAVILYFGNIILWQWKLATACALGRGNVLTHEGGIRSGRSSQGQGLGRRSGISVRKWQTGGLE
jgi:hypothetical protein